MKTLLCQIHQKLIHLNRSKFNRELFIITCVVLGFVSHWLIFSSSYDYYSNYTIGFLRSATLALLFNYVIYLTHSYRLCGLMMLVVISMSLDLASIISTDLHTVLAPYRYAKYGLTINFQNGLATYEILCVMLTFINLVVDVVLDRLGTDANDHVDSDNSHQHKNNTSH